MPTDRHPPPGSGPPTATDSSERVIERVLRVTGDAAIAQAVARAVAQRPATTTAAELRATLGPLTVATVRQRRRRLSHPPHGGTPRPRSGRRGPGGRAVRLVYGAGLTYEAAAERLGVAPSTVGSWLASAKLTARPRTTGDACLRVRATVLARADVRPPGPLRWGAVLEHIDTCAECARVQDDLPFVQDCCTVHPQLSDYQDGRLPAAETARARAHVRICRACQEHLADLQAAAVALMGTGPGLALGVGPALAAGLLAVRHTASPRSLLQLVSGHGAGGMATTVAALTTAAVVSVAAVHAWVVPLISTPPQPVPSAQATTVITAHPGWFTHQAVGQHRHHPGSRVRRTRRARATPTGHPTPPAARPSPHAARSAPAPAPAAVAPATSSPAPAPSPSASAPSPPAPSPSASPTAHCHGHGTKSGECKTAADTQRSLKTTGPASGAAPTPPASSKRVG